MGGYLIYNNKEGSNGADVEFARPCHENGNEKKEKLKSS